MRELTCGAKYTIAGLFISFQTHQDNTFKKQVKGGTQTQTDNLRV